MSSNKDINQDYLKNNKKLKNNFLDEHLLHSRNIKTNKKESLSSSNSKKYNVQNNNFDLVKKILDDKKIYNKNQIEKQKTKKKESINISSSSEEVIYNFSSFDSEFERSMKKKAYSNSKEKNLNKISPENFKSLIENINQIKLTAKNIQDNINIYSMNPIFIKRNDYKKILKLIITDLEIIKSEQKRLQIEREQFEKEKEKFNLEVNSFKEYQKKILSEIEEEKKKLESLNKNTSNQISYRKINSYLKKPSYKYNNKLNLNNNIIKSSNKTNLSSLSKKDISITNKTKENNCYIKKKKFNSILSESKKPKLNLFKKSDSEKKFVSQHIINGFPSFSSSSLIKDTKNNDEEIYDDDYNISKQNNFEMKFEKKYNLKDMIISKRESKDDKIIISYNNNAKEIIYNSGVRQQIFPDGYKIIYFINNDIKQIFPSGKYVYFFFESKVTMTYFPKNNLKIYKYKNGKIEKNYILKNDEIQFYN